MRFRVFLRWPSERHFHSELSKFPYVSRFWSFPGDVGNRNVDVSETPAERALLQILVKSRFIEDLLAIAYANKY